MAMTASAMTKPGSTLLVCTRDLDYGVGSQVKYELSQFDNDPSIARVIVIGPKKLETYSSKISFEIIPITGRYFITREPYFAFACHWKILKIINSKKIDRIYLHFPIFMCIYGVETIYKVHLLHKSIVRHFSKTPLLVVGAIFHYLYAYFDYRTIKNASRVYFVGRSILSDAEHFYPVYKHKFEYRPNTIDKKVFYRVSVYERKKIKNMIGLDEDKINILFVGRLEPLKGIQTVINILTEFKRTDIKLIIAGNGPLKEKIAASPIVHYVGKIEQEKMYMYYNAADLFVMPSYYETFGLTAFEALACGCLILSRDVGDVRYAVDRDCLFTDDDEFSRKLSRFVSKQLRK